MPAPLQVVFSAECNNLFDWHSAAIYYSFELSNFSQVANITRLLACSAEERKLYPEVNLNMGPTFLHRNLRDDPLVESFDDAPMNEGGAGCTIALLRR